MADEHDKRKDRKLIGWQAWYDDGKVYRSDEYAWKDIPQKGFEILKKYFIEYIDGKPNWYGEITCGQDLYVLNDECRDEIKKIPKEIKIGRWMTDSEFHPLYDMAKEDQEIVQDMI